MNKYEQQILDYISRPGSKPIRRDKLASKLGISARLRPKHDDALDSLIARGTIYQNKKGRLRTGLSESGSEMTSPGMVAGIIKRIASGAGFLIPHEPLPDGTKRDVFISPADVRDAHNGDEVLVRLLSRRGMGGRRCGRVEEIIQRATSTFVGTYFEEGGEGFVRVDGGAFQEPVFVGDPGAKGARPEDKVVIEMVRFPKAHGSRPVGFEAGEAVLTEVLGPRGEPGIDTLSIIREFGLPDEFPEAAVAEARRQADRFDEHDLSGRRDLTKETVVTIDPADARDFDDAISLQQSRDGHWHLGVHIADVAHFVRPGTPLDEEALRRSTSVYLPRRVIPMLPEVLSNSLASLQQGKVRYTKTALIEFTAEGVPVGTEFVNSAIRVTRRFAYEEVLPIIREPKRFRSKVAAKVRALLCRMHELAMILRARRFEAGALELNLPEVKIDFDEEGRVTGARERVHDESHQIIEEFMLAANFAVATELSDRGATFLRRVHANPDPRKLRLFSEFAEAVGYPLKKYESRRELQRLVNRVRGEPAERAVNYALLRSMKQAEYSPQAFGHYALGVDHYCHFTSPIRRYPDLIVHRLIDKVASGKRRVKGLDEAEAAKLGKHCSFGERRAEAAERELTKVKLLTYMASRIGEELDAVITGVERFGLFCQGLEIPVEGFVHITAVDPDDYFDFDPATHSLTGRRGGTTYRLGHPLRVSVAHVDVDRRELDFRIVPSQPGRRRRSARAETDGRKSTGGKSKKTTRGRKGPSAKEKRRVGRRGRNKRR